MTKETTEFSLDDILPKDIVTLISCHLDKTDELQETKSLRRRYFPLFRTDVIQTNRILARLTQYAFEGNIAQIRSLLKIRPDLRIQVLFTLAGLGGTRGDGVYTKRPS
ncbi:hypothetical protein [Legionella maioricensis]|uniref:Uncharacterized protein n=1 Tax=Legionella maioricensis TaxID=2896528 RepID=A0A9X2CZK2_9GAMM|nr:hypothetical protein [Legionella maioricensis]MCL9683666.1 hypothetical protein [Legionella maioricensis]MCL9687688.1 hypothetical protein [Legionella maioricensis]